MTHLSSILLFTPTSTLPLKYRTNSHPLQQNLLFTPPQSQFNTTHFKSPPSIANSKKWRNTVSFFQDFLTGGNKERDIQSLKDELYETIAPLERGAEASPEDQQRVDKIASKLEAVNSVKEPLNSDLLNGKWELLYTTSQSILQTKATANLVPLNSRKVAVKFDFFKIASLIPIKSPGSGRGELEITYLDQDLRISRGNRGNLFILKMVDPSYRVPV
ncbi:probable plastid-lipid-associated protein 4, chloroplastic [Vicia villosa]|uniref:probable plastid-lipid-associated protein 4, chloroplastic n=1 Tax=Vicia villosa TaxID=3911 RepID=UPI00273CDE14|nr:probable plastid-lipid-associated protein 4, chloroplastic [Vicia villosa]